ncbi:unnamed protein product [Alternaria alternata]|uniref:uncharacterized protein n=1 Tax=Alternaria postmessia TaxID=1187938 RepID=UPI002223F5EF|nr:uncharacterized protein J4E82_006528 [Alternaria postmessia]KAI5374660.1 hypothetical protein J4E82_006528 [Alternaria postmessia]
MPYFSLLNFTDAEVREVLYLMLDANDIEFMDRYRDLGLPMRSSTVELIEKHFRSAYQPTKNTATPERGPTSVNDGMYLDDAMILDRESDEDGEGNDVVSRLIGKLTSGKMVKDKGKGKGKAKEEESDSRGSPGEATSGFRWDPSPDRLLHHAPDSQSHGRARTGAPGRESDSCQDSTVLRGRQQARGKKVGRRAGSSTSSSGGRMDHDAVRTRSQQAKGKKVVRRAGSSTDSSGDIMEQGAMLGRSQGRGDHTTPTVDNTKSECFKRERSVSADSMDEVFGQGLLEGLDMHELDSHNGYQDGMPRGRSSTYPRLTPDNNTSVGDAKASSSKAQDHLF